MTPDSHGRRAAPEAGDFNVSWACLMIGHLVLYVTGRLDSGAGIVPDTRDRRAFVAIWPEPPRVVWPPDEPVDYERLESSFAMGGRCVDVA